MSAYSLPCDLVSSKLDREVNRKTALHHQWEGDKPSDQQIQCRNGTASLITVHRQVVQIKSGENLSLWGLWEKP